MTPERKPTDAPADGYDRPDYAPAGHDCASITSEISTIILRPGIQRGWLLVFLLGLGLLGLFGVAVVYLLFEGDGIWGINIPVGWSFAITDFVWWIGIGHAGTLISAILLLLHQKWRTSINRIAEAMTIFGVMCAGMFPLLHMGRPWFFYWLTPYPNTMKLWPQFRSALVWDVFAVSTYFTVSLLFWYMGMIPDLATLRDRAQSKFARVAYGMGAMGWRNSARHWHRYEMAYLLLAGLATPLVLSVHSVVSSDFAITLMPGWHETVFPPYFVAGAIFSGFAMVVILCVPIRHYYGLKDLITIDHLDVMGKVILATSFLTTYGYVSEQFVSLYGAEKVEQFVYFNRLIGVHQYAPCAWTIVFCNCLAPQILWFRRPRRNEAVLLVVCVLILIGMWLERFVIITSTLSRDFLPSNWGIFRPTFWDLAIYFGSIGLFIATFTLFCRVLPLISMAEMKAMLPGAQGEEESR